jgi:hypothetical protein
VGQAPFPALQGAGGRQVEPIADESIPQVAGKRLGTAEGIFGLRGCTPQVDTGRRTLERIALDLGPGINIQKGGRLSWRKFSA